MTMPMHGNGSGKFDIGVHDMGGWVRVTAGQTAPRDELGFYLAHRLSVWLREQPHLRLLSIVPIVRNGDTFELHGWYEQHRFPDTSPIAVKG